MLRLSGVLCLIVAIISGSLLFQTSQSVQRAEQNLAEVKNKIHLERESLRVLGAEWDYLNRPERLEKLTLKNLDMDTTRAERATFIGEQNTVPEPRVPAVPMAKPEGGLQYISTQRNKKLEKEKSKNEEQLIESVEQDKFNSLVITDHEAAQ